MDVKAVQKYSIGSPRKMREVVYLIKNFTPLVAIERLPFTGKRAAEVLRKVILTAVANAKQQGLNPETLVFKEIQINEGPRLKRFQAGARGRAKPYKKRMSHIRVVLTTKEPKNLKTEELKNEKQRTTDSADLRQITRNESVKSENKQEKNIMNRAKSMLTRKKNNTQAKSV